MLGRPAKGARAGDRSLMTCAAAAPSLGHAAASSEDEHALAASTIPAVGLGVATLRSADGAGAASEAIRT